MPGWDGPSLTQFTPIPASRWSTKVHKEVARTDSILGLCTTENSDPASPLRSLVGVDLELLLQGPCVATQSQDGGVRSCSLGGVIRLQTLTPRWETSREPLGRKMRRTSCFFLFSFF